MNNEAVSLAPSLVQSQSERPKAVAHGDGRISVLYILSCVRCGRNHHRTITFEPLLNPPTGMTHWAACPRTKQPIFFAICGAPESDEDNFIEATKTIKQ